MSVSNGRSETGAKARKTGSTPKRVHAKGNPGRGGAQPGAGRPSVLDDELATKLLTRYSNGDSLTRICKDPDMPNRVTVWRWVRDNEEFAANFARARESNADSIEDGMAEIEQQVLMGLVEPQAANVVLSSQRWRARVLHPSRYGDKIGVDHGGKVGLTFQIDLS